MLGDARLGLGKLVVELGLDLLALGLGLGLGGVAGLLADRVGLGARLGKFLLVGGDRGVGLRLQAGGLVEILRDALAADLEDAADARQRPPASGTGRTAPKVIASHRSCDGKVVGSNGGKRAVLPSAGTPVSECVSPAAGAAA